MKFFFFLFLSNTLFSPEFRQIIIFINDNLSFFFFLLILSSSLSLILSLSLSLSLSLQKKEKKEELPSIYQSLSLSVYLSIHPFIYTVRLTY